MKLTRVFPNKKNENYHRILQIQINLRSKFCLQQTILIFGTNFQKKVYFRSKTEKNKHDNWILHVEISLSTSFQLKLTMRLFGPNLHKKGSSFQSKNDEIDTTIEFCIFELIFVSNFTLNKQFWFDLRLNLPKKDIYGQKQKVNIITEFRIFKLVLAPNSSLNWQFLFFWPRLS